MSQKLRCQGCGKSPDITGPVKSYDLDELGVEITLEESGLKAGVQPPALTIKDVLLCLRCGDKATAWKQEVERRGATPAVLRIKRDHSVGSVHGHHSARLPVVRLEIGGKRAVEFWAEQGGKWAKS